eukprot:4277677-Pyramimonas_sp.AAC.1
MLLRPPEEQFRACQNGAGLVPPLRPCREDGPGRPHAPRRSTACAPPTSGRHRRCPKAEKRAERSPPASTPATAPTSYARG